MQEEIKLLNEKLDYLNDGSRRLHGLYDGRGEQIQNLQNKFENCQQSKRDAERSIKTLQDNHDKLQNQLTSQNRENENLRSRIRLLESKNERIQSELTKTQTKSAYGNFLNQRPQITTTQAPKAYSPIFEKNAVFNVSAGYKIGDFKSYHHNYEFSMEIKHQNRNYGKILQGKLAINLSKTYLLNGFRIITRI